HDEGQHQVHQEYAATREQGQQRDRDAYPGHVDVDVRGDAVADAGPHLAFAYLEQALARVQSGSRAAGRTVRVESGIGRLRVGRFHQAHLADDSGDLRGAHHRLVRPEYGAALLADGLFEVGHDLGAIRAVRQARFGAIQIHTQLVIAGFFELVRVS